MTKIMSNKIKGLFWILMFGVSCMTIGMYLITDRPVQPYQVILTCGFGLFFLSLGIDKLTSGGK